MTASESSHDPIDLYNGVFQIPRVLKARDITVEVRNVVCAPWANHFGAENVMTCDVYINTNYVAATADFGNGQECKRILDPGRAARVVAAAEQRLRAMPCLNSDECCSCKMIKAFRKAVNALLSKGVIDSAAHANAVLAHNGSERMPLREEEVGGGRS